MTQVQNAASLAVQYEENGYVLLENAFTPKECQQLKEEGKQLLAQVARPNQTVYVGAAAASPTFLKFASHPNLVAALREIMPDGIMFMSDKFVFKSHRHQFGTPWHQDIAYWPNTRPKLSTWIALDDVTAANGAMKIIPGSHHEFRQHENLGAASPNGEFGNVITGLPEIAPHEMICEMKIGSVLIFSDLLIHASCHNTAGIDRYALIGTYHAPAEDEPLDLAFPARHVIYP